MQRIDATLSELSNVLGGCERIKNTPLPRQYDYYPELMIKFYCVALPFVIVDEVGIFTPVITLFIAFAFLVLNQIGKNLEDPFENQPYDVSMTALCRTIEINLLQAIGETKIPEPEKIVGRCSDVNPSVFESREVLTASTVRNEISVAIH